MQAQIVGTIIMAAVFGTLPTSVFAEQPETCMEVAVVETNSPTCAYGPLFYPRFCWAGTTAFTQAVQDAADVSKQWDDAYKGCARPLIMAIDGNYCEGASVDLCNGGEPGSM